MIYWKIRIQLILIVAIVLAYNLCSAFPRNNISPKDSLVYIDSIKKSTIDHLNEDSIYLRDIEGESALGGDIIGVYNKDQLSILVAAFYGETGRVVYNYFFCEDEIVYTDKLELKYDKPNSDKSFKIKSVSKEAIYILHGIVIRWDRNGKIMKNNKECNFRKKYSELSVDVKKYKELFKKSDAKFPIRKGNLQLLLNTWKY